MGTKREIQRRQRQKEREVRDTETSRWRHLQYNGNVASLLYVEGIKVAAKIAVEIVLALFLFSLRCCYSDVVCINMLLLWCCSEISLLWSCLHWNVVTLMLSEIICYCSDVVCIEMLLLWSRVGIRSSVFRANHFFFVIERAIHSWKERIALF